MLLISAVLVIQARPFPRTTTIYGPESMVAQYVGFRITQMSYFLVTQIA